VQHDLVKESYTTRKAYQFQLLFTKNKVEEANKAVAKALEWKMVQRVQSHVGRLFFPSFCGVEVKLQQVLRSIFPQNGASA